VGCPTAPTRRWRTRLVGPRRSKRVRGRDLGRGMTTIGPHRDDLILTVDGRSLRDYGSTGQLRSAAVALRLLELTTIEATRGVPPALLLDDVFAELDADRQARLATGCWPSAWGRSS